MKIEDRLREDAAFARAVPMSTLDGMQGVAVSARQAEALADLVEFDRRYAAEFEWCSNPDCPVVSCQRARILARLDAAGEGK